MQQNGERWYDAITGRWLSQDPTGYGAGDANLYRYVGNGPANAVDPAGLNRWKWLQWPHTAIVVEVWDPKTHKFVTYMLNYSPRGYETYPGTSRWTGGMMGGGEIECTVEQDKALLDKWKELEEEDRGRSWRDRAQNYLDRNCWTETDRYLYYIGPWIPNPYPDEQGPDDPSNPGPDWVEQWDPEGGSTWQKKPQPATAPES